MARALFADGCFLCRGRAPGILCASCEADLPRLRAPLCPRCALASPGGVCGRCLARPPAYDDTRAALAYEFPADVLVHALKFRSQLALAPFLASLLVEALGADAADCIVPVPLSSARLRERGYNQAAEIARCLGKGAPELALCERTRDTVPQIDLPYDARQRNVRGSFRCTRAILGARVAIVDDVMTTGATLDELARTLKQAGAASVVNWVVARTPPRD